MKIKPIVLDAIDKVVKSIRYNEALNDVFEHLNSLTEEEIKERLNLLDPNTVKLLEDKREN